jgi:O-antigen ligase
MPIAFSMALTLIQVFILGFLTYNLFHGKEISLFPIILVIAGGALFLYSVITYGAKNMIDLIFSGKRLGGIISQENEYGGQAVIASTAAMYLIFFEKKRLYLLVLPFFLLMVFGSGSKIAIISIGLAFVLTYFFKYKIKLKSMALLVIVILILVIGLQLSPLKVTLDRLVLMFDYFSGKDVKDSSTQIRLALIKNGFAYFLERPFFGYGANNYRVVSLQAIGLGEYAHNNYIELLVNGGIIAFLLYYFNFFLLIVSGNKKNRMTIFTSIIFVVLLFMDISRVSYYSKIVYILLAIGYASISFYKTQNDQKKFPNLGDVSFREMK